MFRQLSLSEINSGSLPFSDSFCLAVAASDAFDVFFCFFLLSTGAPVMDESAGLAVGNTSCGGDIQGGLMFLSGARLYL
jgi:hypothetical protein